MSAYPPAQGRPAVPQILLLGPALQPGLPHLLQELLEESGYQAQLQGFAPPLLPILAGPVPAVILLELAQAADAGQAAAWVSQLKRQPAWAPVPLLLLGLAPAPPQLEAALAAGAVDWLSQPVRPRELLDRLALLLQRQRTGQAGTGPQAVDALGHASLVVREHSGRCTWHTALARGLMGDYFSGGHFERGLLPPALLLWLHRELLRRRAGGESKSLTVLPPTPTGRRPSLLTQSKRLSFDLHRVDPDLVGEGSCLIVMREHAAVADSRADSSRSPG